MMRPSACLVVPGLVLLALGCGASRPPAAEPPPPSTSAPPAESAPAPRPAPGVVCTMDVRRCPDGTEVGRSGPRCEFAPCPEAKTCTSPADCAAGEACVGALGCDEAWHCAKVPCTRDLTTYCGCDGTTFQGSGSCPPRKAKKRGSC